LHYWLKIRASILIERMLKAARRRTKVIGVFPDGQSALRLVAIRLRHVSTTSRGRAKYMDKELLPDSPARAADVA